MKVTLSLARTDQVDLAIKALGDILDGKPMTIGQVAPLMGVKGIIEAIKERIEHPLPEDDDDSWKERARKFLENGNCPVCFGTDEAGHEDGCLWGQTETALAGAITLLQQVVEADKAGFLHRDPLDTDQLFNDLRTAVDGAPPVVEAALEAQADRRVGYAPCPKCGRMVGPRGIFQGRCARCWNDQVEFLGGGRAVKEDKTLKLPHGYTQDPPTGEIKCGRCCTVFETLAAFNAHDCDLHNGHGGAG